MSLCDYQTLIETASLYEDYLIKYKSAYDKMLESDKKAFLRRLEIMAYRKILFNLGKTPNDVLIHYPADHKKKVKPMGLPILLLNKPKKIVKFICVAPYEEVQKATT